MKFRMSRRSLAGVFASVAAVGVVVAASGAPAQAASTGWRITQVFGAQQQYPDIQALSADSAKDAWIAGSGFGLALLVEHWTGSKWQALPDPSGFSSNVNDNIIGASSATDMWTFPDVSGTTSSIQYGLHWNGKSWSKSTFSKLQAFNAAVFSDTNAWVFGDGPAKSGTPGYGPPAAARYNGHAWEPVSVPGVVTSLSTLSASDMWAAGPSAKTAGDYGAAVSYLAMHWNGKAWTSLSIPKVAPVDGSAWAVNSVVAESPSNVWVKESVDVNRGGGMAPAGAALLNWNGKKWTTIKNMSYYFYSMASDGSGGLWLSGYKGTSSTASIAHYASGHWSYQPAPTESGYTDGGADLTWIPGTKSLWGIAGLAPAGQGSDESVLLKYGV